MIRIINHGTHYSIERQNLIGWEVFAQASTLRDANRIAYTHAKAINDGTVEHVDASPLSRLFADIRAEVDAMLAPVIQAERLAYA